MNYKETVEYLFNSTPVFEKTGASAYKPGLGRIVDLCDHLKQPQDRYLTIHIAGTNGKGSCSHSLAAILQHAGLKVGLFTSPHLVDFRERIRVNGECVTEDFVIQFVERHRSFFEPLHPSFFELTTAMAFEYFATQQVDIAVIETGLGGRLDSTNVVTPLLSVITNISFDHTNLLGATLEEIAHEKAGIIKPGVPVVIGETSQETRDVFISKSQECHSPILFADDLPVITSYDIIPDGGMRYQTTAFGVIESDLGGFYQIKNMNTVLHAAEQLLKMGIVTDRDIVSGLAKVCDKTGLMGRWQTIHYEPRVIIDTGHNVAGWQYISKQLSQQQYDTLHIVFGMVDDKDLATVMDMLPKDAVYYFTQASTHRAIPVDKVLQEGIKRGLNATAYTSVREAYTSAIQKATSHDLVFVGGSSYVVADLLSE